MPRKRGNFDRESAHFAATDTGMTALAKKNSDP
jgi:hypothetical protein